MSAVLPRRRGRRGARALAALCLLVLGLLLAAAGPAQAHASLIASDPAEGAVLATAPDRISFEFTETIGVVSGAVRVFDAQGEEVRSSASATGARLEVALEEPVEDGTLVVVWRIISDDGHPVGGSLRFAVGAPSATVADISADAGAEQPPVLLQALRVAGYVGLLLTGGLVAFTALVLPAGSAGRARSRVIAAARGSAVVAALAWLLAVPVFATYQLGGGLWLLGEGRTWAAIATAEYVVAGTVAAGVLAAVLLLPAGAPTGRRRVAALVAAGLAVAAPALTGHPRATSPEWLVVTADALHLLAGSVWLGGIVALAIALPVLAERGTLAAEALARFSVLAAGLLAALVASGTLVAWRVVESWSALVETAYGRLLLAKVVTVLAAILLATWNRFVLLPRLQQATRSRERRSGVSTIGRVVLAEGALLGVVLVFTGLLVDRSPDVAAGTAPPTVQTTMLGTIEAKATVASPVTGPSTVTLELFDSSGQPTEGYAAPEATLSSGSLDLGDVSLQNVGPGVYSGQVIFPSAGRWELSVSLRTGEFDNPVGSVPFTVKESS